MSDERLIHLLNETPLNGEAEARERSWRVVQAAYAERIASPHPVVSARRLAVALAAIGAVLALVLTPAGAKVVSAVKDATGIGEKNAKPALTSLPAPGSLVVESPLGPWVVHEDGSKRLLGDYRQATWSPHGLYLAVASGHELAAVTPEGDLHWTIDSRTRIRDPRWSPSGVRVAYRSGDALRLAAGDGTADDQLASSVAPVAPAWRPIPHPTAAPIQTGPGANVLAYVDGANRIVVMNTDTRKTLWESAPLPQPFELAWSSDGKVLVAATRGALYAYSPTGEVTITRPRAQRSIRSAAFLPATHQLVLTLAAPSRTSLPSVAASRRQSTVVVDRPEQKSFPDNRIFSAPGKLGSATPSPDGSSVLVTWPQADQWIFVGAKGGGKLRAIDDVSRQFDPKATGPVAFPRVDGWCCSAPAPGG
jgi:hypothetical protein